MMKELTPAPQAPSKSLIRGPLRPPQHPVQAISYTQAPRLKTETYVKAPESKQVEYREISLTRLPQPFVNPGDVFAHLKHSEPRGP
ncbi:hypothetical protein VTK56DRAFT_1744 [Thermocarpiscus australiensis]